jgi:glycosyltransferase involved in cell wall biosynthesis
MTKITYNSIPLTFEPTFSIIIPTWNNLEYVKLCVQSIRKNSIFEHQVILHINTGDDGTLKWAIENNLSYSYSEENVGVCYSFNAAANLAVANYIVLIDDDNYLAPEWDIHLYNAIEKLDHNYFAISGTRMEIDADKPYKISSKDYGTTAKDFNEELFLKEVSNYELPDWSGSSWYPMVVYKELWNLVGGLSVEFSPGMGSDPDFSMKLWDAGVRHFQGVGASKSYHFMSKTAYKIRKNDSRQQFLLKWFMNISTFYKFYLRMGEPFDSHISIVETKQLKAKKRRDYLKRISVSLKNHKYR